MKVIIENTEFPYELGIRMLKAKYRTCQFPALEAKWDKIEPLRFGEIHQYLTNIGEMQIAFRCIGLEGMLRELQPKLISSETLSKTTSWVQSDGSIVEHHFEDTYELYRVGWMSLYAHRDPMSIPVDLRTSLHFVKCTDTSTGKSYVIWVDIHDVYRVNNDEQVGSVGQASTVSKRIIEKRSTLCRPLRGPYRRMFPWDRLNTSCVRGIVYSFGLFHTPIVIGGICAISPK